MEAESALIVALPGEVIVHTLWFPISTSTAATQAGGHRVTTSATMDMAELEGNSAAVVRPPEQRCLQQADKDSKCKV